MSKRSESNNVTPGGQFTPGTIKAARIALKMSQCELARRAGVLQVHLSNFELGGRMLPAEDQKRVRKALLDEADRLSAALKYFEQSQVTCTPVGA